MRPRFPIFATLVVLAAVAVMLRLGFWQLERLKWKEGLIARYEVAKSMPLTDLAAVHGWNGDLQFRRLKVSCREFGQQTMVGGRNADGQSGWAHWAVCDSPQGKVTIVAGWSRDLASPKVLPGTVTGMVVGGAGGPVRIVADPPLAGLQPNARPDPSDLPNNHFSYAVQWFLFAATALVIYAIALRKRLAGGARDR